MWGAADKQDLGITTWHYIITKDKRKKFMWKIYVNLDNKKVAKHHIFIL